MTPGIKPRPPSGGGREDRPPRPRRVIEKWHETACYRLFSADGDYLAEIARQGGGNTLVVLQSADEMQSF